MFRKSSGIVIFLFCAVLCAFAEGDLRVTEIPGITGWGSISADGRTLVIAGGNKFDSLVLYDVGNRTQKLLFRGRVFQHLRLDPSGWKIIFSSEKNYAGLWIIGADGKGLQPFPSKQGANSDDYYAIWSPDGSKVAWARGPGLWIANADGSGARALVKRSVDRESMDIGYPIDWIENKILTTGTKGIALPAIYIVDASSGKFVNSGMENENQALFCESPDYLMYYHYCVGEDLSFWSVADRDKSGSTAPLRMGILIESATSFSRSADLSTLLVNNEDPNSTGYLHMYLVRPGDME